jgi:hypothetical protein
MNVSSVKLVYLEVKSSFYVGPFFQRLPLIYSVLPRSSNKADAQIAPCSLMLLI